MQAQVAAVRAKVAGLKPVTVFDYDSGQSAPFTGPGLAMPTALISLAGGTNIFASLKQSWTSVSWEQVVAAQPQCIIINDYGTPTAAQKEKFLETFPATKNLPAVKNQLLPAAQLRRGHPRPAQRRGGRRHRPSGCTPRLRAATVAWAAWELRSIWRHRENSGIRRR